jgi:hypothetical protein
LLFSCCISRRFVPEAVKKVTGLNGDAIIQRDIRSNITITGCTARYGRGGWWGVLIFVALKEYHIASYPMYIEVRYVSKWYLSVKVPHIAEANGS